MKLSILDAQGRLEETTALAPLAESLGYERFWVAEHYPQPTPILTAAHLAGLTKRIRIGTAGVLLHYSPPLRTAHDFHFLERVYPGRIDAGFCGGIAYGMPAVERDGREIADLVGAYPERVARLVGYLRNTPGDPSHHAATAWRGALDDPPQIWSLGGGARSAELAAMHGLYFGYSLLFTNSTDDPASASLYRANFVPARTQPTPKVALAVCVSCADTDDQAWAITNSLASGGGSFGTDYFYPRVMGSPATCAEQLRALVDRYAADELVVADRCNGLAARQRCYALLAEALAA